MWKWSASIKSENLFGRQTFSGENDFQLSILHIRTDWRHKRLAKFTKIPENFSRMQNMQIYVAKRTRNFRTNFQSNASLDKWRIACVRNADRETLIKTLICNMQNGSKKEQQQKWTAPKNMQSQCSDPKKYDSCKKAHANRQWKIAMHFCFFFLFCFVLGVSRWCILLLSMYPYLSRQAYAHLSYQKRRNCTKHLFLILHTVHLHIDRGVETKRKSVQLEQFFSRFSLTNHLDFGDTRYVLCFPSCESKVFVKKPFKIVHV